MNESEFNQLRESGWRRRLTAHEEARAQAWLAGRAEASGDWEAEGSLNQLLGQLPDAPLASNFTAQVMQAVEREAAAPTRVNRLLDWMKRLALRPMPRMAWATLLVATLFLSVQQYQSHTRTELTQSLLRFTRAAALPEPKIFQDFETIQRLGQIPPPSDEALWLALNQ